MIKTTSFESATKLRHTKKCIAIILIAKLIIAMIKFHKGKLELERIVKLYCSERTFSSSALN